MTISDSDIALMDECVIDLEVINAIRINIRSQGITMHSIRVAGYPEAIELTRQILEYQEKLNEAAKVPTGNS